MGVGTFSASGLDEVDASLPIPEGSLRRVLSAWSGRGDLLAAVAGSLDDFDRAWTVVDVRRRAHRILLQELTPMIRALPRTAYAWLDALPAVSTHRRSRAFGVEVGVDWVGTRIRSGWPPSYIETRRRERAPHTLLLTTLRWTLDRLAEVSDDVSALQPSVVEAAMPQLGIALGLLDEEALSSLEGERPSGEDLRAVAREGRPWNAVATIARLLVQATDSPEAWATRLIAPDPLLRPTIFHLAVLGTLLEAVESLGGEVVSHAPLTGASRRPAFFVTDGRGCEWEVWFEAGGIWSRYDRSSIYAETTAGFQGIPTPLKPDLLMIRPGGAALLLECKYSNRSGTVGRAGVTQAMAYGLEVRSRLAPHVESYVVAPDGVVAFATRVETHAASVGIITPSHVEAALDSFWRAQTP
jgi:hypothetical protein